MRIALLSINILFFNLIQAQSSSISNGAISLSFDSTKSQYLKMELKNGNADTVLVENISLWIKDKKNNNLSIQKTIDYNNFQYGWEGNFKNEIYTISKPEIADHSYLFSSNSYNAPFAISNWPAKVNEDDVASFVDLNSNFIYEPQLGEYPFIRGDNCMLLLSNDEKDVITALPNIGIQLAQYHYVFPQSGDPLLDNTLGIRWVLKNNSGIDMDSVSFGIHFHALLHRLNLNYIGTDVENNAIYCYSQDKKHFVSLILLNENIKGSMYFKDEGLSINKNDIPITSEHFSFLLESRWKDGDSLKIGSTGLDGDSSISFVFPGKSIQGINEWSEEKVGNTPGDRHGLLIGEILDWKNEEYKSLEIAILYQSAVDSLSKAIVQHKNIKKVYDFNQFTTNVNKFSQPRESLKNPMFKGEVVELRKNNAAEAYFYNVSGELLLKANIENGKMKVPSGISAGIYFVQLKGERNTFKFYKVQVTEQ